MDIVVTHPTLTDIGTIVSFQQAMAMESEGLELDNTILESGVAAVIEDRSKGLYFVAKIGSEIVGSLMVTTEWSDWNNCEYWWIQSVYVKPEYRRKGVFTSLCREVEAQAKADGVKYVRLYADKNNLNAINCYRSRLYKRTLFDDGKGLVIMAVNTPNTLILNAHNKDEFPPAHTCEKHSRRRFVTIHIFS